MAKIVKDYLDLEYEWDGCGDYDEPIVYSEQSKRELEMVLRRKEKILKELNQEK